MAIRSLFVDQDSGARGSGSKSVQYVYKIDVLAADDINDVLFIAPMSGDQIITSINYFTGGVTGLSDINVGFYKSERVGGAVIDDNALDDALDVSASGTDVGLAAVVVGDRFKTIRELVGTDAGNPSEFVLALTLITEPTADGTITMVVNATQS